ncbi:EF-hand domain-containing protein [Rhizobium sp. C4]|uniref:EF-hand domain-containing protein n=1 Tax=Rhizobium sp. C4 TaxID=1349800 RepID=UPI001E433840|nr:EF-hand domain-containing protein [Rhizobium sp. C4]MCD2171403.1 hypothetical protein [Rhizobium sp. C4]
MFSVVFLSSVLTLSTPGANSEIPQNSVPNWLISFVVQGKPGNMEETQRRLERLFDQVTNGAGVASRDMFTLQEAVTRAQRRSMFLSGILQKDIDGDGTITKQDLDVYYTPLARQKLRTNVGVTIIPTQEQQADIRQKAEEVDFKLDANGDQRITFDEMLQDATRKTEGEKISAFASPIQPDKLMMLDQNLDGTLTKEEYSAAIAKAFKQVDSNGDGTLSQDEIRAAVTNPNTTK